MTAPEADRVLQVHDAKNLPAAAVEAYIDWRKALVEAVVRAELSGAATTRLLGHELCVRRLASPLPLASSYREGREWTCECTCCRLMNGIRNYLAHHWTRGGASFAISGGRGSRGSVRTEGRNPNALFADAPAAALRRRRDRVGPARAGRGAMEKDFAGCG